MEAVPHFLVIGAQKAGTTWLSQQLSAHPEIYSPKTKELHFFDKKDCFAKGHAWYAAQFAQAKEGQICGEYTPNYLWEPLDDEISEGSHFPGVAARAQAANPSLRWIAILRDPVARAISAYYHHIRARRIRPDQPISAVWGRYGIRSMGRYARQLEFWRSHFPAEQGKIIFFETDILQRPSETLLELYRFLGVDPSFTPSGLKQVHNRGNSHFLLHLNHRLPPLARLLQKYKRNFGQSWSRFKIPVQPDERAALHEYFIQPNQQLSEMLETHLPW